MKKLHLAEDLAFPADAITQTFGLLAVRGAGKTNAARVMAEEMYDAGLPFVAIDPVGSWWGLRAGRDGSQGLAIPIFGGRRGDVPLEKTGGPLLADLIVDQRLSCVVDLSQFESEQAKKTFLVDFARRLYQRNEAPLHLFLEEADDYIPQRPLRDEAQLLRAWENIVRRGRSRGLGMTLITQRSASVNKSVLTQVQTLIAMRTTGPQDRAAIEDWLKYNDQGREILESLPSLESGEAWVWSPQFLKRTVRIRFRMSRTLDSGATPKMGKDARTPATLADVDLVDIQKRMSATIEKAKADDPKALRARIADLEARLAAGPAEPAVDQAAIDDAVDAAVEDAVNVRDGEWSEKVEALKARCDELEERLGKVQELVLNVGTTPDVKVSPAVSPATPRRSPTTTQPTRPQEAEPAKAFAGVQKVHQKILDALAWFEVMGVAQPARGIVAAMAGASPTSSSYGNNTGHLRTLGLLDYPRNGIIQLTPAGRRVAKFPKRRPNRAEVHEAWRNCPALDPVHVKILNAVIAAYPQDLSREELAGKVEASPTSSSYGNNLGRLSSLGIVKYPKPGRVVATELLFPR